MSENSSVHIFNNWEPVTLNIPEHSNWTCYMFGNRPGGSGFIYTPRKGQVPNAWVRFWMGVCFDCKWVKNK